MANINLSGSINTTGTYILGATTVEITSDSNHTLTAAEYTNQFLNITSDGSMTGARSIIAPLIFGNTYIVKNSTTEGFSIEFRGITGANVLIQNNTTVILSTDGTDYFLISNNSSSSPLLTPIQPQSLFTRGNAGLQGTKALGIGSLLTANASGLISSVIYDNTTTGTSGPSYWFLRENSNDVVKFDTSDNRINVIPFDDLQPAGNIFDFTVSSSNGEAWVLAGFNGLIFHINAFPEYIIETISITPGRFAHIEYDSSHNALIFGAWAFGDEPNVLIKYDITGQAFSSEVSVGTASESILSIYVANGFLFVSTIHSITNVVKVYKCNLTTLATIGSATFPDTNITPNGWSSYIGDIYVAATNIGAIYRINTSSLTITKFTLPGSENAAAGTAVDINTPALWVSGSSTNTAYQITSISGTMANGINVPLSNDSRAIAAGIAFASSPSPSIIITDEGLDKWYQFAANGTNLVVNNLSSIATEIAAGPDGYVLTSNGPDHLPTWQVAAGEGVELPPQDLVLHEISNGTLPGFQGLIELDEEFTNPSLARFTITSEGTPNTPTIASNQITFVNNSGQNTLMSEGSDLTVPQFASKIHIVSASSTAGNAYENSGVGYIKDSNNFILAVWRKIDGDASIQVKIGGTSNFRGTVSVAWTPPFDIGLSLVANSLVFWQKPNGGSWTAITSWSLSEIDFTSASLTGWKAGFALATDSVHTFTGVYSSFQSGLFGGVGIRDICVYTNPDGSPIFTGNAIRATATMTDTTGAAYCAIITYDIISKALNHIGTIFVNRSSHIYNDNAAHCIVVGDGTYRLFITTWGTPTPASSVQIQYKHEIVLDLRSGINVVSSMAILSLPNIPGSGGAYDPFVILNGLTYYIAYTIGPSAPNTNYPALASTLDLSSFTGIAADTTAVLYEGTRIIKLANAYWVCAGSSLDTRVYDLTMTFVGYCYTLVEGTTRAAYPPHPMLVPFEDYTYDITFDNSKVNSIDGTQGQFRVFRALRFTGTEGPQGPAGPAATPPTGTGLVHIVSGVQQATATTIVDADVNSSAAIAVSKLAAGTNTYVLTTTGGVPVWAAPSGGGSTPTGTGLPHIISGVQQAAASLVVNADVDSAAAIAVSKLAAGSGTQSLAMVSGTPTWITVAGDWSGAMTANVVSSLTGSGGTVSMKANNLTFANTVSAPTISVAAPTGFNTDGTTIVYGGQNGSSSGSIGSGGLIVVQIPKGGSAGAAGGYSIVAGNPSGDQIFFAGPDGSDSTPTCPNCIAANAHVIFQPSNNGVFNTGFTDSNQYEIQTTNATPTTICTYTLQPGVTSFSSEVIGAKSTNGDGTQMVLSAVFLYDGSTTTVLKASSIDDGPNASSGATTWTAAWSNSSATVTLKVTGAGSTTINWSADVNEKVR